LDLRYALFKSREIPTRITAPTNATSSDPMIPPPCQIPNLPKIQPPSNAPRIPKMISTTTPYPPPFITCPASQPAISPTTIHSRKCISIPLSIQRGLGRSDGPLLEPIR